MTTPCQCGCGSVVPGTCGCCEGIHPATPRPVVNRPYLDALSYRVGTHESFLATMLARLSGREFPTLHELAARTGDDAAIALLDAWATVGDVLTFYQERIANEGYLRTATERRSVLEAARLVGYELRPGVAASTYLAYTVDKDTKGNDTVVTIPKGSRAQSVPGPGELPQPFETSQDVVASSAWNDLKPRLWRPLRLLSTQAAELEELYLEGIGTNLKPGDVVLLVLGSRGEVRVPLTVKKVTPEQIVPDPPGPPLLRTIVTFEQPERAPLLAALGELDLALQVARDLDGVGLLDNDLATETDTDVLDPLASVVEGRPSAHRLGGAVEDALAKLRERLAVAEAKGEAAVAAWSGRSRTWSNHSSAWSSTLGRRRRPRRRRPGSSVRPRPPPAYRRAEPRWRESGACSTRSGCGRPFSPRRASTSSGRRSSSSAPAPTSGRGFSSRSTRRSRSRSTGPGNARSCRRRRPCRARRRCGSRPRPSGRPPRSGPCSTRRAPSSARRNGRSRSRSRSASELLTRVEGRFASNFRRRSTARHQRGSARTFLCRRPARSRCDPAERS